MSSTLHLRAGLGQRSQHFVICGNDGLVHRLTRELDAVSGEAVTAVLPSRRDGHGADVLALHRNPHSPVELLVSERPDERTLRAAGVEHAAALALTYGDDQTNMTAALLARSINPSVRLVVRMFHRDRGRHLELLLDRAAAAHAGHDVASTTILSDADTAVQRGDGVRHVHVQGWPTPLRGGGMGRKGAGRHRQASRGPHPLHRGLPPGSPEGGGL
ncbi:MULTISPECIES: NAD-binding protein [unclassified Streptomyces]|uniref:NAD-binding protein n=1 Tax=unclassified Streptomyces TaxID=2593676 RepID=UPI0004BD1D3A|nr:MULTISPECIES: NAD-binding protein [unclassified Streptomyces]